jgi:hypothetical protein
MQSIAHQQALHHAGHTALLCKLADHSMQRAPAHMLHTCCIAALPQLLPLLLVLLLLLLLVMLALTGCW